MAEVFFYHLERTRLEDALPLLLEKALERGMRCLVQCEDEDRAAHLDDHLWTYREDAFLPHGRTGGEHDEEQPVLIGERARAPSNRAVLFAVDGARPDRWDAYERTCVMFDGGDEAALAEARRWWAEVKAAGVTRVYWRQTSRGDWEKGG